MLQALHRFIDGSKPIYGMNRGTVGFLMNEFRGDDLPERLAAAQAAVLHPLRMLATDARGETQTGLAINGFWKATPARPARSAR